VSIDAQRPAPPNDLTPPQANLWKRIVADSPPGWFRDGDTLLLMFCRHAADGDWLSKMIDAEPRKPTDLKRLDRLLAMRERETRMLTHLATKMRLTPQSRIAPRSAGRAMDAVPLGKRPWECD
jgi:hypothetical protein